MSSFDKLNQSVKKCFAKMVKAQGKKLETVVRALGQKTLEYRRQLQDLWDSRQISSRKLSASPHNVQEGRVLDNVPKRAGDKSTLRENVLLSHSALFAAMVTTAIALFSAVAVFSGKDKVPPLFLGLPKTTESCFSRNQTTEVKAFLKGKKARSFIEAAASEHEKDETEPLSGELGGKYQEQETRPAGDELPGTLKQKVTGQEDKDPTDEHRVTENVPTLVVRVQKGDTLYGILKRQFGKSGKILTGAVRELNPDIEDLDRIRVGQKIRLPVNLEVAYGIHTMRGRSDLSIKAEVESLDE
jgi:hypothetical protein